MSYWSGKPLESDFASGAVSRHIQLIKTEMFKDIEVVEGKDFPEQSIIASLMCLRAVIELYPKVFRLRFSLTDYLKAKKAFEDWYAKVNSKIPAKYRKQVLDEANEEFKKFEEKIFKNNLTVNPHALKLGFE